MIRSLSAIVALAGCYSPPQPDCGFICGPGGACPASYTCASDHHCQRDGAPTLDCGPAPIDALMIDAPTPPKITFMAPMPGDTGIPVDLLPDAQFDQFITAGPHDMYLMNGATMVAGIANADSGVAIVFIPDAQLPPLAHLTVGITSGVTGAQDGLAAAPSEWSFDTEADHVAPRPKSSTPKNNDVGVPVTTGIRVRFDEAVNGVDTTSFTALDGSTPVVATIAALDARTYELRPVSSLTASSAITVSLGSGITDVYGNALFPTSFRFTTGP